MVGEQTVALITARGGSKRLPRKNILPICGKPVLAWTIEAARAARAVDRVILSTEDEEIARIGRDAGAETPFMRPADLSSDTASHVDVIHHAIDALEQETGQIPDRLVLLQPTSPLRSAEDIDAALALSVDKQAESVLSVTMARDHPMLVRRLETTGKLSPFMTIPEGYLRTQDLEPAYALNGAVYVLSPQAFRQRRTVLSDSPLAYVMPRDRSLDVDDLFDLELVEALMRLRMEGPSATEEKRRDR